MYLFIIPVALATITGFIIQRIIKRKQSHLLKTIQVAEDSIPDIEEVERQLPELEEAALRAEQMTPPSGNVRFCSRTLAKYLEEQERVKLYHDYIKGNLHKRKIAFEGLITETRQDYASLTAISYRIRARYHWFLLLSAITVIFHANFVARIPSYLFIFFLVADVMGKFKHRGLLLICQIIFYIFLIGVYALRPF